LSSPIDRPESSHAPLAAELAKAEHADLATPVALPKVIADFINDRCQHARRHIASVLEVAEGIVGRTSAAVSGLDARIASVGIVGYNCAMHTWGERIFRPVIIRLDHEASRIQLHHRADSEFPCRRRWAELSGGLIELGSRYLAVLLAILLEALGSFLGRVDVVGPRLHPNALDLGLRDVGLVLRKIVRAERVVVAAVVSHDLVGQRVEVAHTC